MEYKTVEADLVIAAVPLDGGIILSFEGTEYRRTPTGTHGKVAICVNNSPIAWDTFNLGRDPERVRLANSAYKQLKTNEMVAKLYPSEYMKRDLDRFCWESPSKAIEADAAELIAGTPDLPIEFLAHPHLVAEGGTVMFAPGGRGKSYTALLLAICLDGGVSDFWQIEQPRKTLYLNLERGAKSIARRIGFVNLALQFSPERPLLARNARGRSLSEIQDSLAKDIERHEVECVFVDSISRSGFGDLNENSPINKMADMLNRVAKSWFAIAHTPRQDQTHAFGSVMLENAADIMLMMRSQHRDERTLGVTLDVTKENDIGPQKKMVLEYRFDAMGLTSVAKGNIQNYPELLEATKPTLADEIASYLYDAGDAPTEAIAEEFKKSRSYISQILNADPRFNHSQGSHGKHLWAVK